jgi:hypothetical protein
LSGGRAVVPAIGLGGSLTEPVSSLRRRREHSSRRRRVSTRRTS